MKKFVAAMASAALLMAGTCGAFAETPAQAAKNSAAVTVPGATAPAAVASNGTGLAVGTKSADLQKITIAGWVGIAIVTGGIIWLITNNGGHRHHATTTTTPG